MRNNVKYMRRSAEFDVTQKELADAVGVDRTTIAAIEKGTANPSGELLLKISAYFKRDPRDIFFIDYVVSSLQNKSESA